MSAAVSAAVGAGCAAAGLGVGWLLTTVVHRVPAGEPVLRPGPACRGCAAAIRGWASVPVVSWVALRGRCRACAAPFGARYPLVELATATLFGLVGWRIGAAPELPAYLYLTAVGIALAAIDLTTHRLPDALTLPAYVVVGVLLTAASALRLEWEALARAAIGGAALFGCYYLLAVIAPHGMGFGDVKLAGVLGIALGWAGWAQLVAGALLGFLYGGLVSLGLLVLGRVTRKTRLPFGPFMLTGAFTAVVAGETAVASYLSLP